jgi:hypothetical protein
MGCSIEIAEDSIRLIAQAINDLVSELREAG